MSTPRTGRRRAFWIDPRFAIGVALVAASVAGVYAIVANAERSILVYAARTPLVSGSALHEADLVATTVRLGGADRLYLTPDRLPDDGAVLSRTVAAGELVPASALTRASAASQTSIVIPVAGELPAAVAAGASIDVWSAQQKARGQYGPPAVLIAGATVVRVVHSNGIVADRNAVSVEVRVPAGKVAGALAAIANDDAISLVPGGAR